MGKIFVGIDVSENKNAAFIMNDRGNKITSFETPNDRDGAERLIREVQMAAARETSDDAVMGIESTSIYGDHVIKLLQTDPRIAYLHRTCFMLNAKTVSQFKKAYPELPKTDPVDAFVIADKLRFGRCGSPLFECEDSSLYGALKVLTRQRMAMVEQAAALKQRFGNMLFLWASGLAQSSECANSSATTYALLDAYDSVDDLANAALEEITDLVKAASKNHYADPEKVAETFRTAARKSYSLPVAMNRSVKETMQAMMTAMKGIRSGIAALDRSIASVMGSIPNTLSSVPGIGPVYAAGILAEVGPIDRFRHEPSLAKYAGLWWPSRDSGKFSADNKHLTISGNRYLRYYLIEAANSMRRCDSEYGEYYRSKCKEVPTAPHRRSLVLTARKLCRLVFRLLKDKCLYTPRR